VAEVSTALRAAPDCDAVVFVARVGHTDRRQMMRARELLDRARARVSGLVLVGDPSERRWRTSTTHADRTWFDDVGQRQPEALSEHSWRTERPLHAG
jgi:Mrp family chromosome partitioning ATPase